MAGQSGNTNAQRHGCHGYLTLGRLPKGASYIRRLAGQFRKAIEAAVVDRHGELTLYHAALVQSATRHEIRSLLLTRWMRSDECNTLGERMTIIREVTSATEARDRCLEKLGLAGSAKPDPFAALYSQPINQEVTKDGNPRDSVPD